jgi:APA family basic amino acid/polyamine antiporter
MPALAASAFVLLFVAIACLGVRASGGVQIVTSILKIVPLVGAIALALVVLGGGGEAAPFAPAPVGVAGISGAAALTLWAMLGFESAAVPADKVVRPERTIPRTTLLGTFIAGLFYLAASTAVFLLLPADTAARSSAPFADLAGAFLGSTAATLVVMFAAISCLGALNGWILLQAEVPLIMARRGVFPSWFGRVNRKGVPVRGQLTGALLSIALIAANYTRGLTELFAFMALLATVATLVLYLVGALAALWLMRRHRLGGAGIALLAILGVIYSLWAFYGAGKEATGWGAALLASGIPVYLIMRAAGRSSRVPEAGRGAIPE